MKSCLFEPPPSRRRFLQLGLTGTLVGLLSEAPGLAVPLPPLSPDEALTKLLDGNKRFTSGHTIAHEHDLDILRKQTVEKQEPFAAILSCADSRIPVEIAFDQSIGHIFVARVAGNVITPEIIAGLEYGAAILGTKVILVLGHADCGAVKATIECEDPGNASAQSLDGHRRSSQGRQCKSSRRLLRPPDGFRGTHRLAYSCQK
jgi:carbonic anhydrase